jgi:hypothetical protein
MKELSAEVWPGLKESMAVLRHPRPGNSGKALPSVLEKQGGLCCSGSPVEKKKHVTNSWKGLLSRSRQAQMKQPQSESWCQGKEAMGLVPPSNPSSAAVISSWQTLLEVRVHWSSGDSICREGWPS